MPIFPLRQVYGDAPNSGAETFVGARQNEKRMGQQQLLLIVGGIVVVGLAIVVGITTYSENSAKTNSDALFQDALGIATEAQLWKGRPELFGGSPDATKSQVADFSEVDFYQLGYTANGITEDGECYQNQNGQYALFAEQDFLGILGTNVSNQNLVGIVVTGSSSANIELFEVDWNPIVGGAGADGSDRTVQTHKRCSGPGNTPMHAGTG